MTNRLPDSHVLQHSCTQTADERIQCLCESAVAEHLGLFVDALTHI